MTTRRTLITCPDPFCEFGASAGGEGLPVVVVDEEIYRLLPSLLIATVDKFAQMPWRGETQALFGQVSRHCTRHGFVTRTDGREVGTGQLTRPCIPARGTSPPARIERRPRCARRT